MSPATANALELTDSTSMTFDAGSLVLRPGRDRAAAAARLGEQFISMNQAALRAIDVSASTHFDGDTVRVRLASATTIGAIPLRSPSTGAVEHGLVVRPRYEWSGLGPMLAMMGWRVTPMVARLPNLPRSDRRVPPWVLSSIVLVRLERLLRATHRTFSMVERAVSTPRGQIEWRRYASQSLARGRPESVPCRFPALEHDRTLLAAIHFALRVHSLGLGDQRATGGAAVRSLLEIAERLLREVREVPPERPEPAIVQRWLRVGITTEEFHDGIDALGWTAEERGLGGLSDLHGLPWTMNMETFFEAWIETLATQLSTRIGGVVKVGRQLQTIAPLRWEPPFVGSQRYLLPDVVLRGGDTTIVFDAKYKTHFEELNVSSWRDLEEALRERHRDDLLQVLAYSTLFDTPNVVCCLVYPCKLSTWELLRDRGRTVHRAGVSVGSRQVDLILTAIPMSTASMPVENLAQHLRPRA